MNVRGIIFHEINQSNCFILDSYVDANFAYVGTHDIKMAEILPSTISITYFTGSNATGALLSQVCFTDTNTSISISTSIFQMLHRSQRPIPYNLMACHSGQIQIFLYDIEGSGTLSTDANYLAAAVKQRMTTNTPGKTIIQFTRITDVQCRTHYIPGF